MISNEHQPYAEEPASPARVVIKFADDPNDRTALAPALRGGVSQLQERFPNARIRADADLEDAQALLDAYRSSLELETTSENPLNYVEAVVEEFTYASAADRAAEIADFARSLDGVSDVFVAPDRAPPPVVDPSDDGRSGAQGYLNAAPDGIDARFGWTVTGGDGAGIGFVDVERGWTLNHEDLASQGIQLVTGVAAQMDFPGHGTAVLGEVMAADNDRGVVGITPSVWGAVACQWQPEGYRTDLAIRRAVSWMANGDVLLLEAQSGIGGQLFPVEIDHQVWNAIRFAVDKGIVVVEAGANGSNTNVGHNLDQHNDATWGFFLDRNHANFRDSGAIMVGAATSSTPHSRLNFSNFGSRIDCYAWGQNIETTGDGWQGNLIDSYTSTFGGTSGASPIVSGAAIALQGMAAAAQGRPFSPSRVRDILVHCGTPSANPAVDQIGVMPDIHCMYQREIDPLIRPRGDFPTPRQDVMYAGRNTYAGRSGSAPVSVCIDPAPAVAAYGGGNDVTLKIAEKVRGAFGGSSVQLLRGPGLASSSEQRLQAAKRAGAPMYLSLATSKFRGRAAGPEVWVYGNKRGRTPEASMRFGRCLCRALESEIGRPVPLRTGPLASIHPAFHGTRSAAAVVEIDNWSDAQGARSLNDQGRLDQVARALAMGMRDFMSPQPQSYRPSQPMAQNLRRNMPFGRPQARGLDELDLTDFSSNAMVIVPEGTADRVPANITQSELDQLERAWDCMMRGTAITVSGSDADKRAFRGLLLGGLVFSPFIRRLFIEMACDSAHPITFHVGRNQPGIYVDAFQFPGPGEHTFDLDDFEQLPQVSGNPRNYMQLRTQILVHALREARQGTLGNAYLPSHRSAIDDENTYRLEQGQIGHKDYSQPTFDAGTGDVLSELTYNGVVEFWERWHPLATGTGISSITYSP